MRTNGNQVNRVILTTQFAYNGDGAGTTKTVGGDTSSLDWGRNRLLPCGGGDHGHRSTLQGVERVVRSTNRTGSVVGARGVSRRMTLRTAQAVV